MCITLVPQEKLQGQIRESRFSSLNQIREQARENLETEQNITLMEEKKRLMVMSNSKIAEKTSVLQDDVDDIGGNNIHYLSTTNDSIKDY